MKFYLLSLLCCIGSLASMGQSWDSLSRESTRLYHTGYYGQAQAAATRACQVAQQLFGRTSEEYITALSNRGYAQAALGDMQQSLNSFREAASLSFKVYALPHASQMEILGEVAKTFISLGTYDSAEHYLLMAQSMYVAMPQKNARHYDTASVAIHNAYFHLNALNASLHHRRGQLAEAIDLLLQQAQWYLQLYPERYSAMPDYQVTISNLASYFNEMGNLAEAARYTYAYYQLVHKDGNQRDVLYALQNLGSLHRNQEQYDSALLYWYQAHAYAQKNNLSETHVHAIVLNNLGELYFQLEHYDSAIYFIKQSITLQEQREAVNPPFYETSLFNLAEAYRWSAQYAAADSIYTTLVANLLHDIQHNFTYLSDNEKLAFYEKQVSVLEHYAAFALEVSGTLPLQQTDTPYINPHIAGQLYNIPLATKAIILNASRQMKQRILQSGDSTLIGVYTLWEARKNALARALLQGHPGTADLREMKIKVEENEKWLTAYSRNFRQGFQVQPVRWQQVQQTLQPGEAAVEIIRLLDGLLYAALVITPQTTQQPVFSLIKSTRSKHLDRQFYQYYKNAIQYHWQDTLSYTTYWQPILDSIKQHLPGHQLPTRVYVSNDGVYHQINLNTLQNPVSQQYVLDETEVVVLTNTKELVQTSPPVSHRQTAALFGQPQFSAAAHAQATFVDLPGTGAEVQAIHTLLTQAHWQVHSFLQANATEHHIKSLSSPGVLHVASHGFFRPPAAVTYSLAETMLSAGIALAGANDTLPEAGEDGLLTAYEVLGLDLEATDLVVLSACETGRGVAHDGEGVYGLQRALRVAGAKNIIMSLWKVDDVATQQLMTVFYKEWLKNNNLREAFRAAQQLLRADYPQPAYWGAFVLAGKG